MGGNVGKAEGDKGKGERHQAVFLFVVVVVLFCFWGVVVVAVVVWWRWPQGKMQKVQKNPSRWQPSKRMANTGARAQGEATRPELQGGRTAASKEENCESNQRQGGEAEQAGRQGKRTNCKAKPPKTQTEVQGMGGAKWGRGKRKGTAVKYGQVARKIPCWSAHTSAPRRDQYQRH